MGADGETVFFCCRENMSGFVIVECAVIAEYIDEFASLRLATAEIISLQIKSTYCCERSWERSWESSCEFLRTSAIFLRHNMRAQKSRNHGSGQLTRS